MATQTRELPARHRKGKEGEIAREFERHRWLRWFALTSMIAIASWILIALFGPVPDYKMNGRLPGDLTSPEFMQQLEALSGSALQPHTQIQELPNGIVLYEAELKAIESAQKSINWEAYIFQQGEIAERIVNALTERARAGRAGESGARWSGQPFYSKKVFHRTAACGRTRAVVSPGALLQLATGQ